MTGASGGIGVVLTEYLLERGLDRLALQYNTSRDRLFEVVVRYGLDPDRHCFRADLSDEHEVRKFGEAVGRQLGTPWGLINLAGATSNGMSWTLSLEDFQQIIQRNLTATFLTCREFVPTMREANGGRIINISSVVAFTGAAGASHYCAAKAGIVGFTKALARELVTRGITANVVALGYFDYGMLFTIPDDLRTEIRERIPACRFGTAGEIGGAIRHLLSEDGAYTTGQVLHINGGLYG